MRAYCGWLRVVAILWPLTVAVIVILAQPRGTEAEAVNTPSPTQSSAERLVAQHDCSVFGYGDDLIPGHAIVDVGNGPAYVDGQIGFDLMESKRPGTLYAWCI